ncbi:hypothetical protein QUV83_06975 [Cellulomonas cellasea]|uniref:hypothetical protein n=1 Tax=Cellulomonas cellasea TaxID=43670 RepID=UPI0025A37E02|nr:hypothetical protein [Cellulomonas cellasea]MDM8084499.1 hypothetical protein [Cellulomonas cellasea]
MTQQIVGWKLGVSPTWGGWQPGEVPVDADAVAERLADGPAAQDRVRAAVQAVDAEMREAKAALLQLGVWVPDRSTGEVYGTMVLELRVDAPSAADFLAAVRKPPRDRSVKVFHHDSAAAEVDAGPAVVVTRAQADRKTRVVLNEIEWTVFPPGATDAVQIVFGTPVAEFAQALADESVDTVNRLTVTLGQAV